jgi:hypothetical protein
MWTLVVLVLNSLPPAGITVFGFIDQAACLAEARRFCDGEPGWRCKCIAYDPTKEGAT